MILNGTGEVIRLVTGSAASISWRADYADYKETTTDPVLVGHPTNAAAIATATTTTLVSGVVNYKRKVKILTLENNHASASTQVTVQHFDAATAVDVISVTLLAGENLYYVEGEWQHRDSQGGLYTYAGPPFGNLGPTGTIAETIPREFCTETNATIPTASGTLFMQAIYLKAGQLVSNISISSATTAAGTPTNYFFALYSGALGRLAVSANQTTTAWAANTYKTLAMTTAYRVPTSGLYYIGLMMTATTIITTKGNTAKTGGQLAATVPILHGTSSTGLTTAMPDPAAAITGGLVTLYAAVS